ncbi:MAG: GntR family transcriptional regulator [Bryobacteraceae bacterium]
MELPRLVRKRATDEVYDAIRSAILSRAFLPGQRLNVEEIAAKLGVSLTPVRHALQQLASEGLIEIHPRSGTYVTNVSARDIKETFDIRMALECLAGELALPLVGPQEIAHFQKLLTELAEPVTNEESLREHDRANSELHQAIIEASGNKRLTEMYESLNAHIKIARIHAVETNAGERRNWPERLKEEHAEHTLIVAAIENRDSTALTASLRKHITRAKEALVEGLSIREGAAARSAPL